MRDFTRECWSMFLGSLTSGLPLLPSTFLVSLSTSSSGSHHTMHDGGKSGGMNRAGLITINHCRILATCRTTRAAGHYHQCRVLRSGSTRASFPRGSTRNFLSLSLPLSFARYVRKPRSGSTLATAMYINSFSSDSTAYCHPPHGNAIC